MFKKILIANRGEIAVRVMQTAKKMGIETVAIYSEADANSLHVKEADEAYYVGPAPSTESYLNIPAVLEAIKKSGAEAVHPGYGFLSENAEFANALKQAGVVLIGPNAEAVKSMGDKIASKKLAMKADVSTVPGVLDAIGSDEAALNVVKEIGYPVIIKAAAGGGGKGMRIARDDKQLLEGIKSCTNEAASSFKDGRVFIERFFDNPRHIEIQILADNHGNVLSLGERECSVQRRHQKVIEEAPSAFINDKTRKKMSEQAIALARTVNYNSAGTVEFIVDEDQNFYFLEMNTRLQVEHRVTELITGIDLVEQMIRIAANEKLAFTQKDVKFHGWAIESRIYAEDPKRGFMPSTGRITRYQPPVEMDNVLVDTGIYDGSEISPYYDPMVAKVCSWGEDRTQAIETMKAALSSFIIEGIAHNGMFLEAILNHQRFVESDISTNFIDREYAGGFKGVELTDDLMRVFVATATTISIRDAERASKISQQVSGRERAIGASWIVNINGEDHSVYVRTDGEEGYFITRNRKLKAVKTNWQLGQHLFTGTINDMPVNVQIKPLAEGYVLTYGGASVVAKVRTPRTAELAQYMPEEKEAGMKDELVAPIAGMIVSIRAQEGQEVKAGQELLVIEAMKMENVIHAETDVVIKKINVNEKESVSVDQLLIEFAA
ncbi:MAG: acetyl-CoA carboxylase biotin carboxylase subunit [Rickettsiales bacterium]